MTDNHHMIHNMKLGEIGTLIYNQECKIELLQGKLDYIKQRINESYGEYCSPDSIDIFFDELISVIER